MKPEARRAYANAWAKANRDKVNAYARRRYAAHPEKGRAKARRKYHANPEAYRAADRRRYYKDLDKTHRLLRQKALRGLYGLSLGDYEALYTKQEGRCACCGDLLGAGRATHVDHNHTTGVVRGLLCRCCNLAIGHLKDDPARALAAAVYLERHSVGTTKPGVENGTLG